jgi:cell fate (sporulation/competence/biofilm development) regulator YlbF (YheA/YmcA/DUF963 family)
METVFTPILQEAAGALTGNLLASEAFIRYQRSQARLNENHQARGLLEQLSQAQASLRKKQASGSVTQAEVDALRAIQEQVQKNAVITDYAEAQQQAVNFLREINTEISQLLGINFASFANHSTC